MFSFRLGKEGQPSQLIIGRPEVSNLTYFPVKTESYYWSVPVASLLAGGQQLGDADRALIDTGTSLILLPRRMYARFLQALGDSCYQIFGQVVCICGEKYPDLLITLVDREGQNWEYSLSDRDYLSHQGPVCFLSVESMDDMDGLVILGDVFIQKHSTN